MKKFNLSIFIVLAVALLQAQIINIPADFPTIQQGIDAAGEGDTVLVQPGTFVENILIDGKNITLASLMLTTQDTSYITQTIVDGNESGSVIHIENVDSTFLICGFTITNGRSAYGGGIYCQDAYPWMEWLDVISNTAVQYSGKRGGGYGGGIYIESYTDTIDSGIRLKNSKIRNNLVTGIYGGYPMGMGGGLFIGSNTWISIQLYDVLISGNESASGGGLAIEAEIAYPLWGSFILSNVIIQNNSAVEYGGGLLIGAEYPGAYISGSLWTDVIISANSASCGGGIAIGTYSTNDSYFQPLVLENFSVENNHATEAGGGIYVGEWAAMIIEPGELLGYISNFNNIHIMNNTCDMDGGGIYCEGHLKIDGNDSVYSNILIWGNHCLGNGGGLCFKNPEDYGIVCRLNSLEVSDNMAGLNGGGIWMNKVNAEFSNLLIVDNHADSLGGGVYRFRRQGTVINSTFSGNTSAKGGALYWENDAYAQLKLLNCILWNDEPDEIDFNFNGYTLIVNFCDVQGEWPGDGNISLDPLFNGSGDHPYLLSPGSPCVDAGIIDTSGCIIPGRDILGNLRFWDGNEDGDAIVDIGAYELGSLAVYVPEFNIQHSAFSISCFPNPFYEIVHIEYEIANPSPVRIMAFNALGEQMAVLADGMMEQGQHQIIWNVANLPTGLYFCKMIAGKESAGLKLIRK